MGVSMDIVQKPKNLGTLVKTKGADYWQKVSEKETLALFHAAAEKVPAYKDFLKKNKINPRTIKTIEDFALVPAIDKENYLRAYPYEKLLWDGELKKPMTIHSTSGSTGEPTYFQRDFESDLKREFIIDMFFKQNELTTTGPTLFVITFGMGVWSAGMGIYTGAYLATNLNKYPISIISPGVNKTEVLKVLRTIAPNFKQVVIAGYPPFVKDIIDEARQEGIDLQKFNLRFVFTGESFTEEFRDYLSRNAGIKNVFIDTMNTYGSSELGAMAVETPLSILVRRQTDKTIFTSLFGDAIKIPTLAQYVPYFVNFECIDGELFFTGNSTIPLVKYRSGDSGGILTYDQIKDGLDQHGVALEAEIKKHQIVGHTNKLPFVYVFERKNLATTFYGILIYPEFLKAALLDAQLNRFLTGKFTLIQKHDNNQDQYLEINLELKRDVIFKRQYEGVVLEKIVETLKARSSEFGELCRNLGENCYPKLVFWPYEHKEYFGSSSKQQWVRRV